MLISSATSCSNTRHLSPSSIFVSYSLVIFLLLFYFCLLHLRLRQNEVLLQLIAMRSHSRVAQYRLKHVRERTQERRLLVDLRARDLQNLQYELAHLDGQIARCLEFRSKDERIPLVPLDHFHALAPPEVAKRVTACFVWFLMHKLGFPVSFIQWQLCITL
jgi:hypothetical protein